MQRPKKCPKQGMEPIPHSRSIHTTSHFLVKFLAISQKWQIGCHTPHAKIFSNLTNVNSFVTYGKIAIFEVERDGKKQQNIGATPLNFFLAKRHYSLSKMRMAMAFMGVDAQYIKHQSISSSVIKTQAKHKFGKEISSNHLQCHSQSLAKSNIWKIIYQIWLPNSAKVSINLMEPTNSFSIWKKWHLKLKQDCQNMAFGNVECQKFTFALPFWLQPHEMLYYPAKRMNHSPAILCDLGNHLG